MSGEHDTVRIPPKASNEAIFQAVQMLSAEVLHIRHKLEPLGRWTYVSIVVGSAFLGGVVTNLALWLAGAGTVLGLHR